MHCSASVYRRAAAYLTITAAAGQDGQAQTGVIVDRAGTDYSQFLVLAVPYTTTLAEGKKLFLKSVLVESSAASDMSGATTLITLEDSSGTAVATGGTGGSTETGVKCYSVPLGPAARYIRAKYTPDLDATGTDTAGIGGLLFVFDPPRDCPTT